MSEDNPSGQDSWDEVQEDLGLSVEEIIARIQATPEFAVVEDVGSSEAQARLAEFQAFVENLQL